MHCIVTTDDGTAIALPTLGEALGQAQVELEQRASSVTISLTISTKR